MSTALALLRQNSFKPDIENRNTSAPIGRSLAVTCFKVAGIGVCTALAATTILLGLVADLNKQADHLSHRTLLSNDDGCGEGWKRSSFPEESRAKVRQAMMIQGVIAAGTVSIAVLGGLIRQKRNSVWVVIPAITSTLSTLGLIGTAAAYAIKVHLDGDCVKIVPDSQRNSDFVSNDNFRGEGAGLGGGRGGAGGGGSASGGGRG